MVVRHQLSEVLDHLRFRYIPISARLPHDANDVSLNSPFHLLTVTTEPSTGTRETRCLCTLRVPYRASCGERLSCCLVISTHVLSPVVSCSYCAVTFDTDSIRAINRSQSRTTALNNFRFLFELSEYSM